MEGAGSDALTPFFLMRSKRDERETKEEEEEEVDLFWTHHYNNYCYWWKKNCVVFGVLLKTESRFQPFLSLSLHYHYHRSDWSQPFYPNTLKLMTTARRQGKGGLVNAGINNAALKKNSLNCPSGLKCSGDTSERIETKSCFDVSVWMCIANKPGPRDSIRLLIVPTLQSCFTTLINKLSVKHTIGQQMILFHRFLDLTDELFTDVLPLVQRRRRGRRGDAEEEKTKKFQNV